MPTVFLRHKVADYDVWRPIYDAERGRREAAGLREVGVYRDASDPNQLVLGWDVDDIESFNEFIGSEDLQEAMAEAGVITLPELWVGDAVK